MHKFNLDLSNKNIKKHSSLQSFKLIRDYNIIHGDDRIFLGYVLYMVNSCFKRKIRKNYIYTNGSLIIRFSEQFFYFWRKSTFNQFLIKKRDTLPAELLKDYFDDGDNFFSYSLNNNVRYYFNYKKDNIELDNDSQIITKEDFKQISFNFLKLFQNQKFK